MAIAPPALTYLGSLDDRVALYPFCARPGQRQPRSRGLDWRVIEQALKGPPGVVEEGFLLHWASLADPAIGQSPLAIAMQHQHLRVFTRAGSLAALVADRRARGVSSVRDRVFDHVALQSLEVLNRVCADAGSFVRFPQRVVDVGTERLLLRTLQEQRLALCAHGLSAGELDDFGDAFQRHRRGQGATGPKTARTAWEDAGLQLFGQQDGGAAKLHRLMRVANRVRHIHQAACVQVQTGAAVAVETGLGQGLADMLSPVSGARRPLQRRFAPLLVPRAALHRHFARLAPSLLRPGGPLADRKQAWLAAMQAYAGTGGAREADDALDAQRHYEDALWRACGMADQLDARRGLIKGAATLAGNGAAGLLGGVVVDTLRSVWRHMVDAPAAPARNHSMSRRTWLETSVGAVVSIATLGMDGRIEHGITCLAPNDEVDLDAWSLDAVEASGRSQFVPSSAVLCTVALDAQAARRHVQALPRGPVV